MENIDRQLKSALIRSLGGWSDNAGRLCPDDAALEDYVSGGLSADETPGIERHISTCKTCLDKLSLAFTADRLYKEGRLPPASPTSVERAKRIAATKKRRAGLKRNVWFAAAAAAFLCSFLFPRYFLQCLTAAILLGIKWIAESENARTLILVLDSWRRHEHKDDEEISQKLKDRNGINALK